MDFHRGATLATAPTLGLADSSDLGPTAGNGFYRRWPDDLAMLQAHGITDIRLTLDWARLQPRPGIVDGGWADQYEQIVTAADAIGLRVWATMFDGHVPRWFDNEGGIGDDDALISWWPRFVERVAERFGDLVGGWVPFSVIPEGSPDQPWRDTWGILGDGEPPVIASVAGNDTGRLQRISGLTDQVGIDVASVLDDDVDPTERQLADTAERWGESIAGAARETGVPAAASLTLRHGDPDVGGRLVAALVRAIDIAVADRVDVTVCFVDPGLAGPNDLTGLFDTERSPQPALAALLGG
jgi:hypothetical protein